MEEEEYRAALLMARRNSYKRNAAGRPNCYLFKQRLNAWRSSGTLLESAPPRAAPRASSLNYALVYAEKKNDGEAPYSVSFTATQNGDVIVQLHPHSQLERAVRHERQAQATEPPG